MRSWLNAPSRLLVGVKRGSLFPPVRWTPSFGQRSLEISYGDWERGSRLKGGLGAGQRQTTRLIHKRPEGEFAAVRAPQGKNSGAGAKPEQKVCG
jgi:hypothetical protein